jgi:hypothetical protein
MTETEIIQGLNSEPGAHDKCLSYLYSSREYRDTIVSFFKSKGLTANDCNLLWTDVVVKFATLVKNNKYTDQGKMIGYLKNLAGYLFLNHIRDEKKYKAEDLENIIIKDEAIAAVTTDHKELKALFSEQLERLGSTCTDILMLWASNYSMEDIMQKLNLISVEATRKRKHICMKQLLDNIKGNNSLMHMFKDYYFQ